MPPHVVRADHLPPEGEIFDLRFDAAAATALLRGRGLSEPLGVQTVEARVRVFPGGADVFVLGALKGAVVGSCSRCLETCEQPLEGEFHLTFVGDNALGEGGELELHREDLDLQLLEGGDIDLDEVVAEQVLLQLSSHPVCSAECKGLCPVCGGNRNRTACNCDQPVLDPRFASLAALRRDGDESDD